jgi:hypothetical protein
MPFFYSLLINDYAHVPRLILELLEPKGVNLIELPIAVEYAPPGAALNVYCGINVPPAFTDTVP